MKLYNFQRKKGQLPVTDISTTLYAMLIIGAITIGVLLFYVVFVSLRSSAHELFPSWVVDVGEPGKITYNIKFIKAAMQPYAYASMLDYIGNGILTEQALMSMYANDSRYFQPAIAKPLLNALHPVYLSMEIQDYKDPLKKIYLVKHTRQRCGDYAEGVCVSLKNGKCPAGMKQIENPSDDCKWQTQFSDEKMRQSHGCCVEDDDADVQRCGPASNPKLGVCEHITQNQLKELREGFCPSSRTMLKQYKCKGADNYCCNYAKPEDWVSWTGQIQALYSADVPLFYMGKPGYLRIKNSLKSLFYGY